MGKRKRTRKRASSRTQLDAMMTLRQKRILALSQLRMPSERGEQFRKDLLRTFNVHGDLTDKQWWYVGEMVKGKEGDE